MGGRRLLPVVLLLALVAPPATSAATPVVSVDNSQGNVIAVGAVVRDNPANALVMVTNSYHFWAAIDREPATGDASLRPASLLENIGGLYAAGGLIGPGAIAAYDGTFDPTTGGAQAVRVHNDVTSAGGAAALAGNLLTIIADGLGGSLSASSSAELTTALKLIGSLPDYAAFVQAMQGTPNLFAIVSTIKALLASEVGRSTIRQALADLHLIASDADLVRVASVVGVIDGGQLVVDLLSASIWEHTDGTVTFSVPSTVPPSAAPTPTLAPTSRPTSSPAWSQPEIIGVSGICSSVVAGIDASGRYHLVAGCDKGILYAIKAPGGAWTKTTLAPPAGRMVVGPQIAFEGNTVFLGYTLIAPGEGCGGGHDDVGVYYRTRTMPNGGWTAPIRIGVVNDQLDSFRESGGMIYATVENSAAADGGFAFDTKNGATQHSYPIRDAYGPVSMRVGTDGRAQIVYASAAGITYGVFGGSGFSTSTAIRDTSGYAYAPVLVLDGANRAHFLSAYGPHGGCANAGPSSKDGTYYTTNASGVWKSTRVSRFVGDSSLQVDNASGQVHAVVMDLTDGGQDTGGLTYLTAPVGGSWSSTKLTSLFATSPVIRLDQSNGTLLVAFIGPDGIDVLTRP